MQIIQNRVTAATPEEAIAMIYAKHNPIKPPHVWPVMQHRPGKTWYEYTAVIEEG